MKEYPENLKTPPTIVAEKEKMAFFPPKWSSVWHETPNQAKFKQNLKSTGAKASTCLKNLKLYMTCSKKKKKTVMGLCRSKDNTQKISAKPLTFQPILTKENDSRPYVIQDGNFNRLTTVK